MDEDIQIFLAEANENLENIQDHLLTLEQQPDDTDAVNAAYRVLHTLKGTSGFFSFVRLQNIAHKAENLLTAFRQDESGESQLTPTSERMQVIFDSVDRIRSIVSAIENTDGSEPEGDDSDLENRIQTVLDGHPDPGGSTGSSQTDTAGGADDLPENTKVNSSADTGDTAPAEASSSPSPVDPDDSEDGSQGQTATNDDATSTAPAAETQRDSGEIQVTPSASQSKSGSSANTAPSNSDGKETSDQKPANNQGGAKQGQGGKSEGGGSATVRVSTDLLDKLQDSVSELVLVRNQLSQIDQEQTDSPYTSSLQRLDQIVSEVQEQVTQTRMQEIGAAWKQQRRIVRDLNKELGKQINLTTEGDDAELDRQILEALKEPLQHVIRNAADHGIEKPEERRQAGKDETGNIHMQAHQEAGHIVINIIDDGRGLDADKIGRKAVEKGLTTREELDKMAPDAIRQFLFKPGFSTADQVTSISGRGVGMDAVRAEIERIGGTIDLTSTPGRGTNFSLKIPLTLAIISALIIQAGNQRFALPQSGINEIVRVARDENDESGAQIEWMQGARLLRLRDRLLPLVTLRNLLGLPSNTETEDRFVVVAQIGEQRFGIVVDKVYDTEEIVVKPTSQMLSEIPFYSGCTILGDGNIVMILDTNGISPTSDAADKASRAETSRGLQHDTEEGDEQDVIIFRTGDPTPKACPLNVVERIDKIETDKIEFGDGQTIIQYRGDQMPLIPFDGSIDLRNPDKNKLSVLVFAEEERRIGLVVGEVEDIVSASLRLNFRSNSRGILGTTIINDLTTELINVADFLEDFADFLRRGQSQHRVEEAQEEKRPPRALYVDDSSLARGYVTPVLIQAGFNIVCASNGEQAIKTLENDTRGFDLIVSDIEMPRKNGLEFAREVTNDERFQGIPMIALSSHQEERDVQRSLTAGFSDHVGKFERDRLLDAIQQNMEQPAAAA